MSLIRLTNILNNITRLQERANMQLSHIEISNFRNLSSITVDFSDDINILVGENNIGKSASNHFCLACFL